MDKLIGFAVLAAVIWLLVSIAGILYPFRPFKTRKHALVSVVVTFIATSVIGANLPQTEVGEQQAATMPPANSKELVVKHAAPETEPVLTASTVAASEIPASCGDGGLNLGDVVAVSGENELRMQPDAKSDRIKNIKASDALGTTKYHQIDGSTTVRRLCVQTEWSEVQIVTPDWLTHVRGWVPNEALREIERTASGQRVFKSDDIYWDDDTSSFKDEIIKIVNRIARENNQCKKIDTYSIAKSGSRSKPSEPVFFVTCNSGASAFNVWFSPNEAEAISGSFGATKSIGRTAATQACESYAKSIATHPSTVNFSHVWDLAFQEHPSGRARLVSSFTAKNGLNLELKYRIDCLFEGTTLLEANIAEASR
ncbi:hypothetical protein [Roseobacter sp. N2S]|uniref:hypothetical protein n=1 Tax=Roseobacter sp. N2S TaxID=2663844 RepID=UPI002855B011|nr:hypothetical protein [Roseobacter sp. N2S]MDR6265287.1 hypothetical protein [Roseobacter sp. N2S]